MHMVILVDPSSNFPIIFIFCYYSDIQFISSSGMIFGWVFHNGLPVPLRGGLLNIVSPIVSSFCSIPLQYLFSM